jgi:hypothetical protein
MIKRELSSEGDLFLGFLSEMSKLDLIKVFFSKRQRFQCRNS